VTGDTLFTQPADPSNDPAFDAVRRTIGDATLAFTNLDMSLFGREEAAREVARLGFDIVSLANDSITVPTGRRRRGALSTMPMCSIREQATISRRRARQCSWSLPQGGHHRRVPVASR
jgi:hypothetical protein